jgi:hypothetical protein
MTMDLELKKLVTIDKKKKLDSISELLLGQVNLISRLSSRVINKYGAGGRILFYNFYFPQEETIFMTILFLSTKGASFNAFDMCS